MNQKMIIGNAEAICLPELGITHLEARIDTGAQTSSLHVDNLECTEQDGQSYVEFDLHPDVYHLEQVVRCKAPLKANRKVKSSNGTFEHRCVITTMLRMGDQEWSIDITLTNREKMTYMMLLGRQGMADKVLVDPSQSHLLAP
ncbi:ATP-dependent zinc protease [Vibrio harveyi]|mgnify:FL=1|uniref:ATP-dependent zinc protease family protein n=1 Tax=Vibrio harveyi TaxID=669 RepID=UPI000681F7C9|nr:RimK/LysX family protein [Vibrio harveyi]EKO3863098.1 ATP-dependent zinc protease [Vibrio harveyi]ELV8770640.1 ATP-dependent zinc protease [Vibrio harveyi]MCG9547870.1 RimK/LysX family protein [Vibrio harveyi]PNM51223.1 ATP-dependent zinc protease [Vibrio harveyi]RCR62243.1 ATP-dependent zinc protease [Vibrio harveyi]